MGAGFGLELHMLTLLLKFVLTPQVFDDFALADHSVHVATVDVPVKGLVEDLFKVRYKSLVYLRHFKGIVRGGSHRGTVNPHPASRIAGRATI